MNENENKNNQPSEETEEPKKKSRFARQPRRTQSQALQEALNIQPDDLKSIEGKLAVVKFLDYVSEEPLDFIFKDRVMGQYTQKVNARIQQFDSAGEEDKLLKKGFEDKKILEAVTRIKTKSEEVARSKGVTKSVEKKFRNMNYILTAAMLGVFLVIWLLQVFGVVEDISFVFYFICVLCLIPQFLRNYILKKWHSFKEENRNEVYTLNREDIVILKSYAGEVLANVRSSLIELEVPLDLIKFSLFHRDYGNLNVIHQRPVKGLTEYFVSFEYPEGMEPFPIPESLQQKYNQPVITRKKKDDKPEKNFVILTDMKGKEGVITGFLPRLKDNLADEINQMLSDSDFTDAELGLSEILPNYSTDSPIYCICGEIAHIESVHVVNWKNKFKFYLFEGEECKCGDQIYAISLMDEADEIPGELKEIFSS